MCALFDACATNSEVLQVALAVVYIYIQRQSDAESPIEHRAQLEKKFKKTNGRRARGEKKLQYRVKEMGEGIL